jgi:hypothetical protein
MIRLLLLLCWCLPLALPAQTFGGGLLAGLNISQIDGDQDLGFRQPGMFLGGFLTYRLKERVALQPEIVFEQLGSRDRLDSLFNLRLNYTSFNLLLQGRINLNLGDSSQQEIVLEIGPAIGYLVGATENLSGRDQSNSFSPVDVRGLVGGTLQMSERWAFSLRYGYSMLSMLRSSGTRPPGTAAGVSGLFHHYLNFSLRYTVIQR